MEMSLVDRVRSWIGANFRRGDRAPQGPIACDDAGIALMDGEKPAWSLPWSRITRINAFRYPGYVGDAVTLVFEGNGIDPHALCEEMSGWQELLVAIPHRLVGALPPEQWYVQLIAQGPNGTMRVFERAD
jgi:hypothetical protein